MAAFRAAAAVGARGVECDVRISADGVCFLIHDEDVGRTTDGRGRIGALTAREIKELDAGSWYSPAFAGEPVPTLIEALALFVELDLVANIEIKTRRGREREVAVATARTVAGHWPGDRPWPLISSFSDAATAVAAAELPEAPRALLVERLPRDWPARAFRLKAMSVHCRHDHIDARTARAVKEYGLPLTAYTIDRPNRARELFALGVDSIITNVPSQILPIAEGHYTTAEASPYGA